MPSKFPTLSKYDEIYTPAIALDYVISDLDNKLIYWEACYGEGHLAKTLESRGFNVLGEPGRDALSWQPTKWDVLITNPPFSQNKQFISRAIDLGKPFALLVRLEHLGGVNAAKILSQIDFQLIIPDKRINYITPKVSAGIKTGGSPFHSIWLTYGLHLPKQINYRSLDAF
jgi:hypothetical protein